jgi:hypothetical protein
LIAIAEAFAQRPGPSVLHSTLTWKATKACYRFLDSDTSEPAAIRESHRQATVERAVDRATGSGERAGRPLRLLAPQDTTALDFTRHRATTGLGRLSDVAHQGCYVHTTLLVTTDGTPLGVIDQQIWTRAPEDAGSRALRKERPIEEKESIKWLKSLQAVERLQQECRQAGGETRIVSVGDREADVYDLFVEATAREVAILVRAAWDRRIEPGLDPEGGDRPERRLWATLEAQPARGTQSIALPARPGRPARTAVVTLRWTRVTLRPPKARAGDGLPALRIGAVHVREEAPPEGIKPLEWLLLTTEPIASDTDAWERVEWYRRRWICEEFHRVLKSGSRVEERQLQTGDRLQRCVAIDTVVAWHLLYLTKASREHPDAPCTEVLEPTEWKVLHAVVHPGAPCPATPPSLREVTRWIAQLGGFLGRAGDGDPGPTTLWKGWVRLHDYVLAYSLLAPSTCG